MKVIVEQRLCPIAIGLFICAAVRRVVVTRRVALVALVALTVGLSRRREVGKSGPRCERGRADELQQVTARHGAIPGSQQTGYRVVVHIPSSSAITAGGTMCQPALAKSS